jgi:hypothetical protein
MLISYVDPQTLPGIVLLLRGYLEGALNPSSPGCGSAAYSDGVTPGRSAAATRACACGSPRRTDERR